MCSVKADRKIKSKSRKAGLIFPVGRIDRYLRKATHHYRIGGITPVYLSAVLEYVTAEILELAGNAAKLNKKKRLNPRHILLAIANDAEIREMLKDVTIPSAGFVPDYSFLMKSNATLKQKLAIKDSNANLKKKKPIQIKKTQKITANKSTPTKNPFVLIQSSNSLQHDVKKYKPGDALKITILSEKKLFLGQKLTVVQGNISDVMADAIINPTNATFYMGGQVGQLLMQIGGKKFEEEINKLRSKATLSPAGVDICPGHNFMAKQVIHCNGPRYHDKSSQDLLKKTIKNCLAIADMNNLTSLAFPSVGSGKAGFPKKEAAKIILKSIADYFVTVMSSSIKQIYFVLYDKESIDTYSNEILQMK